jgi:hypothetical protein
MVPQYIHAPSGSAASSTSGPSPSGSRAGKSEHPPTRSAATGPDQQEKLKWFRDYFCPHFDAWVIEPIDRLVSSDALIGFLLMACTIDYLAGYWCGQRAHRKGYIDFINKYFPAKGYDAKRAEQLYDCLRVGLVHNFTIHNAAFVLTQDHPELHLKPRSSQVTILNAGDFRDDLITAKNEYFKAVIADPTLLKNAYRRYTEVGFFELTPL